MPQTTLIEKWPPPDEARAQAIAALADGAQRNLQITQAYHEFTVALARLLGETNVSWCAFATWASKTAGFFIRGDNAEAMARQYLEKSVHVRSRLAGLQRVLSWFDHAPNLEETLVAQAINSVPQELSRQIAAGNLKVFAELAPLYARMLALFPGTPTYDQAVLDRFLASLTPGPVEEGGQDLLVQAFTHYYEAMFMANAKERAEAILCANLLIGFHEQTRLQDHILGGMEAPLENEFRTAFLQRANAIIRRTAPRGLSRLIALLWRRRLKSVSRQIADDWRQISTRWVMTIALPLETLRLGADIPPLATGQMFPEELETLQLAALTAVLTTVDRTPDSAQGSAAGDWGRLADRMNYIADLFRSRQQEASLYTPPFSEAQVAIIHAGGMPDGPL